MKSSRNVLRVRPEADKLDELSARASKALELAESSGANMQSMRFDLEERVAKLAEDMQKIAGRLEITEPGRDKATFQLQAMTAREQYEVEEARQQEEVEELMEWASDQNMEGEVTPATIGAVQLMQTTNQVHMVIQLLQSALESMSTIQQATRARMLGHRVRERYGSQHPR